MPELPEVERARVGIQRAGIVITRPGGNATEGGDRLAGPYANALDDPHAKIICAFRTTGRHCPRCGTEMTSARVGGRTTGWCPTEQR